MVTLVFTLLTFHAFAAEDEALYPDESQSVESPDTEESKSTDNPDEPEPSSFKTVLKRFVAIPIVVTEPAVGNGLGGAIGYFHPSKNTNSNRSGLSVVDIESTDDPMTSHKPPPTVTGVFGGYTANGSFLVGAGHTNTFRDDSVRLVAGAGYGDIIADIYLLGVPFEFNLKGELAYGDVRVRVGDLPLFWGVSISYLNADNEFRLPLPGNPIGIIDFELTDVGWSGRMFWDTRDNSMFPESGQTADLSVGVHNPSLGGDYDYRTWKMKALTFHRLGGRFVLGGRLEFNAVTSDAPFYAVPWVTLRGIPAMRYQGDQVLVGEAELRYRFSERWVGLAFGGLGWRKRGAFSSRGDIYNFGVGGRFRLSRDNNVWLGADIARGPEDMYWYIQVGQAW